VLLNNLLAVLRFPRQLVDSLFFLFKVIHQDGQKMIIKLQRLHFKLICSCLQSL
jgi:hypothetical protein